MEIVLPWLLPQKLPGLDPVVYAVPLVFICKQDASVSMSLSSHAVPLLILAEGEMETLASSSEQQCFMRDFEVSPCRM